MNTTKHAECLTVRDGNLYIDGCNATELGQKFGTPLFVLSESQLRTNLRNIRSAFEQHWPEGKVRIMPAIKACPVTAVRRVLTEEGSGCDVFGPAELEGAIRGGVTAENISVNGSIKDDALIRRAITLGTRIVLDSRKDFKLCEQIASELGKEVRVLFRLKPYIADLEEMSDFLPSHEIREMTQTVKYGIPSSDLETLIPAVKASLHVKPVGVHIHMGRHSKKLAVWQALVSAYVALIKRISDGLDGWVPQEVDFGGGIAAAHDRETRVAVTNYPTPSLDEYATAITGEFRDAMSRVGLSTADITIEVEPGRALHNEAGIHLTTVRGLKQEHESIARRWAEVDTSEVFLGIVGLPTDTPPFDFIVANKADCKPAITTDVVGCTCNGEWLCTQVPTPVLEEGDVIAFLNTGSYIEPMAANFNALPRPGIALVNGENAAMIKRHETIDEVYARDLIPGWISSGNDLQK
ncbi:MAG: diaminopimelate decarboxylase family protein [Pseudomonadales bacterium]